MQDWLEQLFDEVDEREAELAAERERRLRTGHTIKRQAPAFWQELAGSLRQGARRMNEKFINEAHRQVLFYDKGPTEIIIEHREYTKLQLHIVYDPSAQTIEYRYAELNGRDQEAREHTKQVMHFIVGDDDEMYLLQGAEKMDVGKVASLVLRPFILAKVDWGAVSRNPGL